MKSDEEFSQCAIDPEKRECEIRKLCAYRSYSIASFWFCFLILCVVSLIGIVTKDAINTHSLFILVMGVLLTTNLYHLDSKIKVLKILDRVIMVGDSKEANDGNRN